MNRTTNIIQALFLLLTAVLFSCNSSGNLHGTVDLSSGDEGGVLQIHLTDSPLDLSTVSSVIVTIDSILVYPSDDGGGCEVPAPLPDPQDPDESCPPIVIMNHPETFDLLTLTDGATTLLAEAMLPSGFYQRIRLIVASANLVFLDQSSAELKIEPHKVDVPIRFELTSGGTTSITLDFQADASVKVNETSSDKYILRSVVTPVAIDS
ncbi:MAG: DUF4382 domain-containing protein [Acidobacteriota bacterium]